MKATRSCSVEDCERTHYARELCQMHYNHKWARGELAPLPTPSIEARLAAGLVGNLNGCDEWSRSTTLWGYGRIGVGGAIIYTHRLAWELANGPIPPGMFICHHCDNPPCCQTEPTEGYPDGHLFLGTIADNNADMASKGRGRNANMAKTHCPQGHPYEASVNGRRHCRTCRNAAKRARREQLAS